MMQSIFSLQSLKPTKYLRESEMLKYMEPQLSSVNKKPPPQQQQQQPPPSQQQQQQQPQQTSSPLPVAVPVSQPPISSASVSNGNSVWFEPIN